MYRYRKIFLVAVALVSFLALVPGFVRFLAQARAEAILVQEIEGKLDPQNEYREDVIRIEFKENASEEEIEAFLGRQRNKPKIHENTPFEKVEYISLEDEDLREKMIEYAKDDIVESVDVDYYFSLYWSADGETRALPNDWNASNHWYYNKTKMPEVWIQQDCLSDPIGEYCGGDSDIVVAVIDTGLAFDSYTATYTYKGTDYNSVSFGPASEMTGVNLWTNPDGQNANNGYCNDKRKNEFSWAWINWSFRNRGMYRYGSSNVNK